MKTIALPKIAGRRVAAAAFALCLAPGLAPAFATGAQAAEGNEGKWYFGLNVPVMFIDNTKTSVTAGSVLPGATPVPISYTSNGVSSYGLGFRIGGTVGYYVLPGLRVEGELFYGFARVKKTVYSGTRVKTPVATIPHDGKISHPNKGSAKMLGGMANVWYDIDTGTAWSPFIGGGIGIFQTDFSGVKWDTQKVSRDIATPLITAGVMANLAATQPSLQVGSPEYLAALKTGVDAGLAALPEAPRPKDKDTVFAFQVGGGVGYRIDDSVTVQLSYKYQMAPNLQFDGKMGPTSIKTKSSMRIHLFEVGFRYHF
ncbi:MAG: outer membrane beta-barrel protein [Rhodospirillaceae bacterium]|nr:outer membrane beta-barrel protein [Rhodospirillaceae bacterium]